MEESASAPIQPCHTRSISLPSRSHPAALRVEEELHKLRSSLASSSASPQKICDGLRGLADLYESIKELVGLTSCQQILIHPQKKKWVEEELDGSIRLLDLCSAVKDRLATMKDHLEGIQLALRRRDSTEIVNKVNDYVRFGRKADKDIKNCFRSLLKQMEDKRIDKKNNDLPVVLSVLMEAR